MTITRFPILLEAKNWVDKWVSMYKDVIFRQSMKRQNIDTVIKTPYKKD